MPSTRTISSPGLRPAAMAGESGGPRSWTENTRPFRLGQKLVGLTRERVGRRFTGHLDVAAQEKGADQAVGVTPSESHPPGTKTDSEGLDFDFEKLGYRKVPQLM